MNHAAPWRPPMEQINTRDRQNVPCTLFSTRKTLYTAFYPNKDKMSMKLTATILHHNSMLSHVMSKWPFRLGSFLSIYMSNYWGSRCTPRHIYNFMMDVVLKKNVHTISIYYITSILSLGCEVIWSYILETFHWCWVIDIMNIFPSLHYYDEDLSVTEWWRITSSSYNVLWQ